MYRCIKMLKKCFILEFKMKYWVSYLKIKLIQYCRIKKGVKNIIMLNKFETVGKIKFQLRKILN